MTKLRFKRKDNRIYISYLNSPLMIQIKNCSKVDIQNSVLKLVLPIKYKVLLNQIEDLLLSYLDNQFTIIRTEQILKIKLINRSNFKSVIYDDQNEETDTISSNFNMLVEIPCAFIINNRVGLFIKLHQIKNIKIQKPKLTENVILDITEEPYISDDDSELELNV